MLFGESLHLCTNDMGAVYRGSDAGLEPNALGFHFPPEVERDDGGFS